MCVYVIGIIVMSNIIAPNLDRAGVGAVKSLPTPIVSYAKSVANGWRQYMLLNSMPSSTGLSRDGA